MFVVKLVIALCVMGVTLYFAMGKPSDWLQFSLMHRLLYLTGLVLLGALSYFASLGLMGFRPRDFSKRITN